MIMVILVHIGLGEDFKYSAFTSNGRFGVQIFFVISGFLALRSYKCHILNGTMTIKTWLKRKIIKLALLFYVMVIFNSLFFNGLPYYLGDIESGVSILNIFAHFLFIFGLVPHYMNSIIGVEWYLGVLVLLYLIISVFGKYLNGIRKCIIAIVLSILISKLVVFIFKHSISPDIIDYEIYAIFFTNFNFIVQLPFFLIGCLLYIIGSDDSCILRIRKWSFLSKIIPILALSIYIGTSLNIFKHNHTYLYAIFAFLIILANFLGGKSLDNKLLARIGERSYGIYLTHFTLILIFNIYVPVNHQNVTVVYMFCKFALILFVSYSITLLFDNLTNRLKKS